MRYDSLEIEQKIEASACSLQFISTVLEIIFPDVFML